MRIACFAAMAIGVLAGWRAVAQQQHIQRAMELRERARQAQQARPRGPQRLIASTLAAGTRGVVIETPAPILNLLERAEEGVAREDWKLAIDSLQRIIEDPDGALVARAEAPPAVARGASGPAPEPRVLGEEGATLPEGSTADVNQPLAIGRAAAPGALYESARRVAMRTLASLPPEGRRAYGLIHDGKAKGMLERALASDDRAGLADVVSRYMMTRHGDDAVDALASIALDENRPTEAVGLLGELLEFQTDIDVSPERIHGKLAAAHAMLNRTTEARRAADELRREASAAGVNVDWIESAARGDMAAAPILADSDGPGCFAESAIPVGRMAHVQPTIAERTPWRFDLPLSAADVWQRILDDDPGDPLTLPVVMPVVSGSRLFVRQSTGLVALDADDLSVAWRVEPSNAAPSAGALSAAGARRQALSSMEGDVSPDPLNDYVAGAVTAAFGLVFTNEPEGWGADDPNFQQMRAAQAANMGFPLRTRMPTRLVARDAVTGRMAWQRGRTFLAEDPLGEVEFRSPPIAVNDRLWAPYVDQRDLYIAVLSPADGALVKRILVCSFKEGVAGRGTALFLARHDDVVYVPTDQGALVAIDVNAEAPRWAHVYQETRQSPRGAGSARRVEDADPERPRVTEHPWLPTPPVAAGGAVLLAPTDMDELLAFSATDGALLWSSAAGRSNYIIAADDRRVWIGGRSVACLSMADGSTVWFAQLSEAPTGRAVLCGDVLQIATAAGLLTVSAESGELLRRQPVSNAEAPLGNLVCARDSIYSAEPSSARRFPDLQRGFDAAVKAFEQHPDSLQAVLRLAWMRMLRGEPGVADHLLAEAERRGLVPDHDAELPFARARVRALQSLAARAAPEQAIEYLDAAVRVAREPEDRLRSRVMIAERRAEAGDLAGAYEDYLDVGLTPDAEIVESTEDFVHRRARLEIAQRLSRVMALLPPQAQGDLLDRLSRLVERGADDSTVPIPTDRILRWRALADLMAGAAVGARALLELAAHETAASRWERAEQLLRDAARTEASPEITREALVRLAHLKAESGTGDRRGLSACLDRLEREFADAAWDSFGLIFTTIAAPKDGTVKSLVEALRPRASEKGFARPEGLEATASDGGRYSPSWAIIPKSTRQPNVEAPFSLTGDLAQSLENTTASDAQPRLVKFEKVDDEALSGRAFFHAQGDVIFAVNVSDGSLVWSTTLRPLGYFSQLFDEQRGRSNEMGRRAVLDGAVGVFNGAEGLYGVGLDTGRRLWFLPHDTPYPVGREHLGDARMSAGDGAIVHASAGGRLSLVRTRDGVVLWTRDMRGEPIEYVALTRRRALTADRHLQRAHIVNRSDGSMVARVLFRQPDVDSRLVDLVQTEELIVGPDAEGGEEAVRAVSLETGETAWRAVLDKPVSGLFEPGADLIGVGLLGGDILLLDAETGDRRREYRIAAGESIVDARLLGDMLLVRTFTSRENLRRFALVALDDQTGDELWRRDDLSSLANLSLPLKLVDGGLPVVVDFEQTHGPAVGASALGLTLIDAQTGNNLGMVTEVVGSRSATRLNGDFGFWSGCAVVGTSTGIRAFEGDWPAPDRKSY